MTPEQSRALERGLTEAVMSVLRQVVDLAIDKGMTGELRTVALLVGRDIGQTDGTWELELRVRPHFWR